MDGSLEEQGRTAVRSRTDRKHLDNVQVLAAARSGRGSLGLPVLRGFIERLEDRVASVCCRSTTTACGECWAREHDKPRKTRKPAPQDHPHDEGWARP